MRGEKKMPKPLDGKVAVISGASHGLGLATSQELSTLGAQVVLLAQDQGRLDTAAQTLDGPTTTVSCDLADAEQVKEAADRIMEAAGRVDILVNNAGIPAPRSFEETDSADWDQVIGVNLSGVFYLTRALWSGLLASKAGYVVVISGSSGLRGGTSPAYAGAKFGLTGLARAIARSGQADGLRATILYPDSMDTGWRGAPIGVQPATKTMAPAEVARLVGYLVCTPKEFVVNEAVLSPIGVSFL
jgi:NAD(P)-dependent dehydrogenase (short-subunit alcohol dehydrogenase family)